MNAADSVQPSWRVFSAIGRAVEWIAPWLVEVGSWMFGGLIALNLVILAALLTVGPVDGAVLIGIAAFACALPLDVVGIVLLRLIKDFGAVPIDDVALKAFQQAGFPDIETYLPEADRREEFARRRARIALAYAFVTAVPCIGLTLAGLAASLWHMAPWSACAFLAAVVIGALILVSVVAHTHPPQSRAEQALRRRLRERQSPEEAK